jgi:hypothetical protein
MTGNRGPSTPPNMPETLSGGHLVTGTKRKIGNKEVEVIDLTGFDD